MNGTAVAWLVGMGIGAGAVALGMYLRDAPPPPSDIVAERDQLAMEVAALTRRIQTLEQREGSREAEAPDKETGPGLQGTQQEGDEASPEDEASTEAHAAAWIASSNPLTWSDDMVDAIARRLEERAWRAIPTEELLKRAHTHFRSGERGDVDLISRQMRYLLGRELTDEQRADALMQLGMSTRSAGDHAGSEAAFRQLLERVGGFETSEGIYAGYQLGWTLQYAGEAQRGLRLAQDMQASRGLDDAFRPRVRWMEARMAKAAGDDVLAEAIFTELVKNHEGDEQYKSIVEDSKSNLKRMGR